MSYFNDCKIPFEISECKSWINKIYDEHEAQIKEVNRVKEDFRKVALDLDAEASELRAQLKAKDEEIKGLGCRIYHAEGYISDLHNNPKDKKFYDKKARSIVAMLFWEWRKVLRESDENGASPEFSDGDYWYIEAKEEAFIQAHKMLKDNA